VIHIVPGANLKEPDKSFFRTLDISSLLIIPITVSTCSVGILGIDTLNRTRTWEAKDINMLKAASDIIANAWTRQIEIDVRRQKELEAEESRLLVIRADRLAALGTMAAGIIHEITQPLNAINVSAQTILYGVDRGWTLESEQVQKSLNLIVDQIKRMSEIITNMRAFARDGLPTPHRMDNLNTQVERVFTMIGEQMKAHDITVEFDYGDIPETSMNTHQILQVILNLVTNARQALDDMEKDDKRIVIRTYTSDDCVFLDVSDNGPGIPEKLREKIFDPFFTTKEVGKGTGLGLSISAGILLEHKGELLCRDNDMGGATFVLKLPVEVVDT
jgi:C4-dicarboxylate-specific signal transduction histidine kinase